MPKLALAGMRILVMEDEMLIAMDVEQICHDYGAIAVTVMHALHKAGPDLPPVEGFDAAILDVALAGHSTLPFATRLIEAGIPFIFATGHADAEGLFDAFPGVEVVGKPYGEHVLIEALTGAIAARRRGAPMRGCGI